MKPGNAIDRLSVWAVRYALGRMTYAVHDVVDVLTAHADDLSPTSRHIICQDIDKAKAHRNGGPIGMDFDDAAWMRLRAALSEPDATGGSSAETVPSGAPGLAHSSD